MIGQPMSDPRATAEQWAASVAALAVDALLDAGLMPREAFETAKAIVAEEIYVRLCCNDYPPPVDYDQVSAGAGAPNPNTDKPV
jgi:hypothetical protein